MITDTGRRLTEAHRIAQGQIGNQVLAAATALWQTTGTMPQWADLATGLILSFTNRSTALSLRYLRMYRQIETGDPEQAELPFQNDPEPTHHLMEVIGINWVEELMNRGIDPIQAYAQATGQVINVTHRVVMDGGRNTIMDSALANDQASGFHRVANVNACAFCARVSSNVLLYRSEKSAKSAKRWHGHCHCTAIEVYGAYAMTSAEAKFAKVIADATEPGMTEIAALAAIRATGEFSDSPQPVAA